MLGRSDCTSTTAGICNNVMNEDNGRATVDSWEVQSAEFCKSLVSLHALL